MYVGSMYHRIYLHLVWATRDREPLIDGAIAVFLSRILRSVARKERASILEIGMVQTHVHLLARLHPTQSVSRLVQRLKAVSATVATKERPSGMPVSLFWARDYAVKSVAPGSLESVRAYLGHQPQHHPIEVIPGWRGDSLREYDHSSPRAFRKPNLPKSRSDDVPSSDGSRGNPDALTTSGPSVTQHPGDRGDGIPVARGDRDPKEPVKRAKVADDLHVAPVHAEDEPVVPREDSQEPLTAGR